MLIINCKLKPQTNKCSALDFHEIFFSFMPKILFIFLYECVNTVRQKSDLRRCRGG